MVHKFNNNTGKATNTVVLPAYSSYSLGEIGFGVEFSQNGKYLYIGAGTNQENKILQYSLYNYDSASIVSSLFQHQVDFGFWSFQIGVDSKIYISSNQDSILRCIENPNEAASFVIINDSVLNLAPGFSVTGLPDFIQTYFHPAYFDYSRTCVNTPILFQSQNQNIDSLRWNFGDPSSGIQNTSTLPNPSHSFTTTDTFRVSLVTFRLNQADTFTREIILFDGPSFDGVQTLFSGCEGDTIEVETPISDDYTNVFWSDLLDTNYRQFTETDTIGLTLWNFCDTIDQDIAIKIDPQAFINLGADTTVCVDSVFTVTPIL